MAAPAIGRLVPVSQQDGCLNNDMLPKYLNKVPVGLH